MRPRRGVSGYVAIALATCAGATLAACARSTSRSAPAAPVAASSSHGPVIDMHVHTMSADDVPPERLGLCVSPSVLPARDAAEPWPDVFVAWQRTPPCDDPVWSATDPEQHRRDTLAAFERRDVRGVVSGPPSEVARWAAQAPGRVLAGRELRLGRDDVSPEDIAAAHARGELVVLAEVTNQYAGYAPDAPEFARYWAIAEEHDIPVGIHIGTGPPGAPYLGDEHYRARLHSALLLEDVLVRHPRLRVYIMHAGWPMLDDLLAVLWTHPQVYVEIGGIVWALPEAEIHHYLRRIVDAGFGERVMFGSDQMLWPGLVERSIAIIERAPFLTERQKRDILHDNAARFLRLGEEGGGGG